MTDHPAEAPLRQAWRVVEETANRAAAPSSPARPPAPGDRLPQREADGTAGLAAGPRSGGIASWLDRTWGQILAFGAAGLLFPFALSGQDGSVAAVVLVCALLATGVALRALGVWRLRTRHGL